MKLQVSHGFSQPLKTQIALLPVTARRIKRPSRGSEFSDLRIDYLAVIGDASGATMFDAIGWFSLKLEEGRDPVSVVIVDRVDKLAEQEQSFGNSGR